MVSEFQVRRGNIILFTSRSEVEAGRKLGQLLFRFNNLELVEVMTSRRRR